ncbi:MAG: Nramp family divalent metal transporter, partial [Pseudonocardia sp.]|nr:Nramp family divalent metal transporter [Pseudonocardia sp.]
MTATDRPPTVSEIRRQGGLRGMVTFLGPAFVAAIAYVDPGNFATNFSAAASYGFLLLWVIIAANLIAMLIQTLTAKLGMATGRDLPEMCRDTFPRSVSRLMWVQAELVAIATDLAEVIGGAIALNLLFGIPLFTGGLITGVVAFALLALQRRGYRPFELAIAGLLGVILLGFATTVLRIQVPGAALSAGLVPRFDGTESLLLATGILGATVMPHVIYLHSALTKQRILPRTVEERRFLLRRQQIDVVLGMGLAGFVNASML